MEITIITDVGGQLEEINLRKSVRDVHAFDGYMADIIELNNVKIHGLKDLNSLIALLQCARPCFKSGNTDREFFK